MYRSRDVSYKARGGSKRTATAERAGHSEKDKPSIKPSKKRMFPATKAKNGSGKNPDQWGEIGTWP